jgi:hypothetical protein
MKRPSVYIMASKRHGRDLLQRGRIRAAFAIPANAAILSCGWLRCRRSGKYEIRQTLERAAAAASEVHAG